MLTILEVLKQERKADMLTIQRLNRKLDENLLTSMLEDALLTTYNLQPTIYCLLSTAYLLCLLPTPSTYGLLLTILALL